MKEVVDLIIELKNKNVFIQHFNGQLKLTGSISDLSEKDKDQIRILKPLILDFLKEKNSSKSKFISIPVIPLSGNYVVSSAQRRLWVLSQFEDGSVAYNIPGSILLKGKYELALFQRSFDSVIERHESLRTVFKEDSYGEIRQWVLRKEDLGFKIDYKDYRKENNKEEQVKEYISEDSYKVFDLEKGPLLRAGLLQVEEYEYVFYYNMHHIISDGWSMEVLSKDVFSYYDAYKENRDPGLKELRIQYKDYSAWQLSQLEQESYNSHRDYWLESLEGELPLLDLPGSKPRPKIRTSNGRTLATYLNKELSEKLKWYSHQRGGTLFMGLLASLNAILYRYTGQDDVIIGSPIAGREHADLESQIGFYVNTLALRNKIDPTESFDELFSRVQQNVLSAYSHQMYPFDRLVEELDLQRDTSRSAVFDVMLVLQNNGERIERFELKEGEEDQIIDQGSKTSKFDLLINIQEQGDLLSLLVEYNTDVYESGIIESFIVHYKRLLSTLLSDSSQALGKANYLSDEEKRKLLNTFNDTKVEYSYKTVMELFEEQVAKTPDEVALMFGQQELSYRELNEQSNVLAHLLRKQYKACRTKKVGVMLERSLESVISMIGVMKTGACYVPIDHDYPTERVQYIVKDSGLEVIISSKDLWKKHFIKENGLVDIKALVLANGKKDNPENTNLQKDGSYVIYTSGSTGKPKGVLQTHRMLSNLIQWDIHHSGIERNLKHLQYTSFSFDVSLQDCWSVLCSGGTIYIANERIRIDFQSLWTYIFNNGIQVLSFPFSAFQQLIIQNSDKDLKALQIKHIVCSGEQLIINSSLQVFLENNPKIELHNHYGPSETHVVTSYRMSSELGNIESRASIGKPISNSSIYILDSYHNLVPQGVEGELYIGGDNLAIGYLNKDELTKERFISDPFRSGELLYKTGDQGYWRGDGNIEFIGRKDDQVKIRGYRVELGEIEYALQSHKVIEEAVVVARANQNNDKELVAYITSKTEQNTTELRSYLKEILPDHMLPAYYVQLGYLPLTSNGKIDKKALPDPQGLGLSSGVEYVAPRNEIEEKLVKIWQEILQRESIGVKDDFFTLGGHSLKAVRLSNEYGKVFSVKLSLKDLFGHTSIESHKELIRSAKQEEFVQIEKVVQQESYPISDAQRRLWVLSQFEDGSVAYNIPGSIQLDGKYELALFQRAFDTVIERHEILRTVFKENETGEIRQWILRKEDLGFKINYTDLRKEKNKEEMVRSYVSEDSYKAFHLETGPLLRAGLLQLEDDKFIFYFNVHHIISDGWSMEVLSKDVFSCYEAYEKNREPQFKALGIQYKDYSAWQLAQLKEESYNAHRTYWLDSLSGELPLLDLPRTKQRPKIKTHNGHDLSTYIDGITTGKLKRYSENNGGSLFMGLLAAWNILMYRYTSQTDIIIGTPVAGRDHADLEDQIGFYVNTLALRNKIKPEESFNSFYRTVRDNTFKSYSHQMYPFDRLVEELNLQIDTGRSAVFDIMLALQNNGEKIEARELKKEDLNKITDLGFSPSTFDMRVGIQEIGDYLSVRVVYNPDIYDRRMIERLINHYRQLLNALLENPEEKVSQIDYLSQEDRHELLFTFNNTKVDYPKDKTIVDLFEEQVAKNPNNTAVVFEEKELTYKELNGLSDQLAAYLQKHYAIQPDDFVGIQLDKSEWMIISILAVLKAGGAYVPIDPEYPSSRKEHIITDSSLKLLITEASFIHDIDYYEGDIFAIDVEFSPDDNSSEKLSRSITSKNLAYVIYTSGSTGIPKGVMIEHLGLINMAQDHFRKLNLSASDKILQFVSFSFDGSVLDVFMTFISGATLVIASRDRIADNTKFIEYVEKQKITVMTLSPVYLRALNRPLLGSVRSIITAGESANILDAEHYAQTKDFYNAYGPTEGTVNSTLYKVDPALKYNIIPIGRPADNKQIYILSDALKLQPIGVTGEICIGGTGIARGYLNQEELTKEKFIANPFMQGERLYKTGDLGRWLEDGNIEFVGRKDHQVKIRGYRIELGEIEHALHGYQGVEEAVVLVKENDGTEKELVAYITGKTEQNTAELRSHLKEILPEYMLPSYYVQLAVLPLTSNGKIDKKSLPDPEGLGLASGIEYIAPRNETEKKLVNIWQEILQRENIGIRDDFFALGGHSLKLIKMINQINKQFGLNYDLKGVYTEPTIESMCQKIKTDIWFKESKVGNEDDYNEVKI